LNSNEDLFKSTSSEILIGDGLRAPRTFNEDLIKMGGFRISEIIRDTVDYDDQAAISVSQSIINKTNTSLATIGANQNSLDSRLEHVSLLALHTQERFEGMKDIEKSIIELQDRMNSYEAAMSLVNMTKGLSLHKYLS